MYPYHNRIKQRIRSGELIGYYWDDNYPASARRWCWSSAHTHPCGQSARTIGGLRGHFSGLEERTMPRTRLDTHNPDGYRRTVNRIIRTAMARNEIPSQKYMGECIGLSETQTSNRFKKGWTCYELFQLNRLLHFTESERITIFGGE